MINNLIAAIIVFVFMVFVVSQGKKKDRRFLSELEDKTNSNLEEEYVDLKNKYDYTECNKHYRSFTYVYANEQKAPIILWLLGDLFVFLGFIATNLFDITFGIPMIAIACFFLVPACKMTLDSTKYRQQHQEIKRKGTKYYAEVICVDTFNEHLTSRYRKTGQRSSGVIHKDYRLFIKYFDENNKCHLLYTPKIGVPFYRKKLNHVPCYVYVYDDKELITDFSVGF